MKKFLVFTILLLSSFCKISACGYSPFGEDVRYSLFKPKYFNYKDFYAFEYNANLWGFEYDNDNDVNYYEANVIDWYNYTNKKVSYESIIQFNYKLKVSDIHPNSSNEFLNYLFANKKNDAIRYLIFAKRCEDLNSNSESNPWELNTTTVNLNSKQLYEKLLNEYSSVKNSELKRKYAFQCIRAAFYMNDNQKIKELFANQFQNSRKDYIYYWSLYFNCFTKTGGSKMVDVANLMAYCPEKNHASYFYFHNDFDVHIALKAAKNKNEIANIYAYASMQKVTQNLDYLKEIYDNNPNSRILNFLILREINKIEDWVYTPYYTNYLPSVDQQGYFWSDDVTRDKITTETLRARSEKDRLYAQKMLSFLQSVDYSKVSDVALWKAAEIQLLLMTRNYTECLSKINEFEKKYKNEKVVEQIQKIKAICISANQTYGKAIIKNEIKSIILANLNDKRFLFALGRELEFRGNLSDGIALISVVNNSNGYDYEWNANDVEWQGNRLRTTDNFAVFYDYFNYLDFVYSANQLQLIMNKLNSVLDSDFKKVIYKQLIKDKDYLKDLLGTKYLRENRLSESLETFKSLSDEYWTNNYNAWERGKYNEYYTFDQNPFYSLNFTEEFIDHKEKFIVTKLSVIEHLMKYINLANDKKTKDRDYYYFLVANCYTSMTQHGNSWMMRRYDSHEFYGDENYLNESYSDEVEYRIGLLAQKYYQLAFDNSKTDKFKALCLRMIDFAATNYPNKFEKLKVTYPNYFYDLSSCENLEEYFNARR